MSSSGRVELIIGPMMSSKTSTLIECAKRYEAIFKKVLVINTKKDARCADDLIQTHTKQTFAAIKVLALSEVLLRNEYKEAEIVCIDEANFYPDLITFVKKACDQDGKIIFAAGLNSDFEKEAFGQLNALIPYADNIIFKHALCAICKDGTIAPFTYRLSKEKKKEVIGGQDLYMPVCRKHHVYATSEVSEASDLPDLEEIPATEGKTLNDLLIGKPRNGASGFLYLTSLTSLVSGTNGANDALHGLSEARDTTRDISILNPPIIYADPAPHKEYAQEMTVQQSRCF